MIKAFLDRLSRIMTQPLHELSRAQRTLRFLFDLGRYGARQLQHDRAPHMAGALAFRTLFGLLPVMVVGTVIVRAFRGFDSLQGLIAEWFHDLKLDELTVSGTTDAAVAGGQSVSEWLLDLIGQVQEINLAAIGWVGLAVVIYSAISLMVTIEKSFNIIYRAPEGRSWPRRLTIYWTVLTLGPLAIGGTMYVGNWLQSVVESQAGVWSLFRAAPVLWNYLAVWMVTFALYKLIPNTRVTFRPALFGALIAAVLLELGRRALAVYFSKAVMIGQLYGSLGLIPVFMFWVYVMWLIILFGLEVSATMQMLRGRRLEELDSKDRTGLVDPTVVLLVMQVVARHFESSKPTTARQIADEINLPEPTVVLMLRQLADAGILHRLDSDDGAVSLARPPDQVSADELIKIGYRVVDDGETGARSGIIQRLRDAQISLAGQITLAKLAADQARST
jgi:membrane protein